MILYYSATGNTEYIAKLLAEQLQDETLDLLDRIRKQDYSALYSEKPFVICAPVYVCEMPFFLKDYLKKQPLTGTKDVYFVFTSGGYAGCSGVLARSLMRRKGMCYLGHAEFKMPRNYIASDMYPTLDDVETMRRIRDSEERIAQAASSIAGRQPLKSRHVFLFELLVTLPFNPIWVRFKQPSGPFHSTEQCVGCGKCEAVCPINNISLSGGRPVWKDRCAHCMACIGNCPAEAIEYGTITQNKKKYNLGKVLREAEIGKIQHSN